MDCKKSYFKTFTMNKYLNIDYLWGVLSMGVAWLTAFATPAVPFMSIILVLVIFDLATGSIAAVKRGEELQSRGFRRTVEKLFLYIGVVLMSEGMKVVFMPLVPVTYVVAFTIALTEFKSNVENIEDITGIKLWKTLKNKINNFKLN